MESNSPSPIHNFNIKCNPSIKYDNRFINNNNSHTQNANIYILLRNELYKIKQNTYIINTIVSILYRWDCSLYDLHCRLPPINYVSSLKSQTLGIEKVSD